MALFRTKKTVERECFDKPGEVSKCDGTLSRLVKYILYRPYFCPLAAL